MDKHLGGFILLTLLSAGSCKPAQMTCGGKPADIVFVMDASSSIWKPNFEKQLDFVSNITSKFDIGPGSDQTRVAAITFSYSSSVQFHLGDYLDKDLLKRAVKSIPYMTGATNTSDALRTTREIMFSAKHSNREGVVRIAVVITDGLSQDPEATYQEAVALKSAGVQVFAIGVGFGIDEEEMKGIASSPASQFMFKVIDYAALDSIKEKLSLRACEVTKMTTAASTTPINTAATQPEVTTSPFTTTTTEVSSGIQGDQPRPDDSTKACFGKPAEVFFLVDSSSSILMEDFDKQLTFVQHIIGHFDVSPSKTRVGLSTFSDSVYSMINLDSFSSKTDLLAAVRSIPYLSGGTNTGDAIREVRQKNMAPEAIRNGIAHVVIVLTDGQSWNPKLTAEEARLAKEQGLYIFAIGIGDEVDMEELKNIASQPAKKFVFHVNSYSALESIKEVLAIETCTVDPVDEVSDGHVCPERPTDVMFMYDSGRMGAQKSDWVSTLISKVSSRLPVADHAFRFGILADTCPTTALQVLLTSDRSSLSATGGRRDLSSLFRDLRTHAFRPENGARPAAKRVAVLFLDDKLEDYNKIVSQANRSKSLGIEVFVVRTSAKVSTSDVKALISGPLSTHHLSLIGENYIASESYLVEQLLCGDMFTLDNVEPF